MSLEDALGVNNVFVHDRWTGATTLVSVAIDGSESSGHSEEVSISADGRYVAFRSWASNLVNGDTNNLPDIFVRDLQTNQTTRVSVASDGTQANNFSFNPSISADGRYVAFTSWANNLVSGDTNGGRDIFVHDRQTGATTRVSVATGGGQAAADSQRPSISADGRYVAFESDASNLVSGDTNNHRTSSFTTGRLASLCKSLSPQMERKRMPFHPIPLSLLTDAMWRSGRRLTTW